MPEQEVEVVRPLDAAEIKDSIAMTIYEAIRDSLDTTCLLYGCAYPKFRADWRVNVTMSKSPGPEAYPEDDVPTFVTGTLHTHEFTTMQEAPMMTGVHIPNPENATVTGSMPYAPPGVVRKRHGMPVPTVVKREVEPKGEAVMFRRNKPVNRGDE